MFLHRMNPGSIHGEESFYAICFLSGKAQCMAGSVLPWLIPLCVSKRCSPDRQLWAIVMYALMPWLPISQLLMVLMSEARFASQRPYSVVLRLSLRSYPGNR